MPRGDRKSTYQALYNLIKAVSPPSELGAAWITTGRRLRDWDDVGSAGQPALFLHQGPQVNAREGPGLPKWHWSAQVWVYFRTDGSWTEDLPPADIIDKWLDAVDRAIMPPGERQTLGGLVYDTWIDQAIADDGLNDNQAVIVLWITMEVGL